MTLDDQIKAVGREYGLRKNVYPNWVKKGRMTQAQADHEIACMDAAYATLKALKGERAAVPAGWVPVGERLPDDDQCVLIALDDGEVWTGFMDGSDWRYVSADPIAAKVTHWRELPAPPDAQQPMRDPPVAGAGDDHPGIS